MSLSHAHHEPMPDTRPGGRPGRRQLARLVILVLLGLACAAQPALAVAATAQTAQGPARASTPGIENTPLDMVVLVDESGSESAADVQHEMEAASAVAQTPLNPQSRVSVVGFGGADGVTPDQDPTSVVCQPTTTNGVASLEYLARCVRGLHPRTAAEGYNTDYAAALSQAMSLLGQAPAGAVRAVLMMTDGGLSVPGDPAYPQPDWLPAAKHAVNIQLAAARAAGVEVWPLGFGNISTSNASYLQYLASHGGQHACDSRPASKPRAIIVQDSARAISALDTLYAAATCSGLTSGGSTHVPPGQTRVLSVSIPPIASGGAISVNKGNPDIQVQFIAPDGTEVTGGKLGGASFVRSGEDTAVEVLRIANPPAGTWKVRVTAPSGQRSQLVSVTAFWQGAVRVSLLASPPTARPGQRVGVVLSVLGAAGPITSPALLSGIHVQVTATGDGLPGALAVPVHPATGGSASGLAAGDFTGTFSAPSTTGTLTVTGTAVGYGLYATEVPAEVTVSSVAALLEGTVQFSPVSTVQAGQDVHGQVVFSNKTGQSQRVRLALTALPALATVTSPTGVLTVPSGTSARPFTIRVAPSTRIGPASLVLRVVSADHPGVSYGNQQLLVSVRHKPGLIGQYRWELVGLIAAILLLALALYLRAAERRRVTDVRDLLVSLSRDGQPLGAELRAPGRQADTLKFVIRDENGPDARLDYQQTGERPYTLRRVTQGKLRVRPSGRVKVTAPDGGKYSIAVGGLGEPLTNGIYLSVRDRRHDASEAPPPPPPPPPPDPGAPDPAHSPTPASQPVDDIWD
jgi:hypothetical protein